MFSQCALTSDLHRHGRVDFSLNTTSTALVVLLACMLGLYPSQSFSQPFANGRSKFLGSSYRQARSNFASYWNQVTPDDAGKWGSVESSPGVFNWNNLDAMYNYAITNGFSYKHHNLVWVSQQPSFIGGLDSATQRAEVENWIKLVGQRYPKMNFIDVVNEPFHGLPPYANAIGGSGATGWDWVITAFSWARQYCAPGVKLLINEYNVLQSNTVTNNYIALIDSLKTRGLIDGIGVQGHYFEFRSPAATNSYVYSISTLKSNLDRLTTTGLPIYISEFDINEPVDSIQLQNYKTYFPLLWEHPGVKGITLWGYVQYDIWQSNAYLVRQDGSERPALQWLRTYVECPLAPPIVSPNGTTGAARNPLLVWRPPESAVSYHLLVSLNNTFSPAVLDTLVSDTLVRLNPLDSNTRYYWRVSGMNDFGEGGYSVTATFVTSDQIMDVQESGRLPSVFALKQNYPNPFNPSTTIGYDIPKNTFVTLSIYDILGREIAKLVSQNQNAGHYNVTFNAGSLPSGIYFYRLRAGDFSSVKKLILMK